MAPAAGRRWPTAANFAAASVGSETQGSIIMPAMVNGVFGLKTSRGLVSRDYIIPLLEAQDVPGPITRNATDLAVMMTAMAGSDANDPTSADAVSLDGVDYRSFASAEAAGRVRVGVPTYLPESIDALAATTGQALTGEERQRQLDALQQLNATLADPVAARLEAAGLQVVRVEAAAATGIPTPDLMVVLPAGFRHDFDAFMTSLGDRAPVANLAAVAETNAADPANRVPYGQRSITDSVAATMNDAALAAQLLENRTATQAAIRAVLQQYDVDVLFMPSGQQYAAAGFPALSVPNGLDESGRPNALLFMADYLDDGQLIAVAYALEQAGATRLLPDLDVVTANLP